MFLKPGSESEFWKVVWNSVTALNPKLVVIFLINAVLSSHVQIFFFHPLSLTGLSRSQNVQSFSCVYGGLGISYMNVSLLFVGGDNCGDSTFLMVPMHRKDHLLTAN